MKETSASTRMNDMIQHLRTDITKTINADGSSSVVWTTALSSNLNEKNLGFDSRIIGERAYLSTMCRVCVDVETASSVGTQSVARQTI